MTSSLLLPHTVSSRFVKAALGAPWSSTTATSLGQETVCVSTVGTRSRLVGKTDVSDLVQYLGLFDYVFFRRTYLFCLSPSASVVSLSLSLSLSGLSLSLSLSCLPLRLNTGGRGGGGECGGG